MIFERLFAGIQHILPQHLLSKMVHGFMRIEVRWVKNLQIRAITRLAGIDASEALSPDPADYPCFNAWFTRELKPGARVFDPAPDALLCPSDGRISETGKLTGGRILQAKGKDYSLQDLLAGDPVRDQLVDGYFATIYLSPRDYHRVHMPLGGMLRRMIHVPGKLFSVAPYTVRNVPGLFARNERVISVFETSHGPLVVVLVGAMLVASMETVWAGEVAPSRSREVAVTDYSSHDIALAKGSEMGRFNMGSTVIVLLPPGVAAGLPDLAAGDDVKVGQRLATLLRDQ
jgi:phosphatidylserine decarboxylase